MRKIALRFGVVAAAGVAATFVAAAPASADSCLSADGTGVCLGTGTLTVGGQTLLSPIDVGGQTVTAPASPTTVCLLVTCINQGDPIASVTVPYLATTPGVSVPTETVPASIPDIFFNQCQFGWTRGGLSQIEQGNGVSYAVNSAEWIAFSPFCPLQ